MFFFIPSGPSTISLFTLQSKTIILKWGDPNSPGSSTEYSKNNFNLNYGEQPYLGLGGYLDWYSEKYHSTNYEIKNIDYFLKNK